MGEKISWTPQSAGGGTKLHSHGKGDFENPGVDFEIPYKSVKNYYQNKMD